MIRNQVKGNQMNGRTKTTKLKPLAIRMRAAILASRRKRATPKRKRVTETTEQKIERLEASIGSYLRDNMQRCLDAEAEKIRQADARAALYPVVKSPAYKSSSHRPTGDQCL